MTRTGQSESRCRSRLYPRSRHRRSRSQNPTGYYIEWSGHYENQLSARRRLMLVIPAVFVIMSILLYP